ncbi:hypothetical protein [Streptomyces sp. NPDC048428]|uniref:hypothetical protein n=1 Tax=Streptomyces sp. NPDC048428 TaxID=3154503 RepID=UPI0034458463
MEPSTGRSSPTVRHFHDDLAADYDLIHADWDASIARQAAALALVGEPGPAGVVPGGGSAGPGDAPRRALGPVPAHRAMWPRRALGPVPAHRAMWPRRAVGPFPATRPARTTCWTRLRHRDPGAGLAALGYRVTGSDLSPVAVARAAKEAASRGLRLRVTAADMRKRRGERRGVRTRRSTYWALSQAQIVEFAARAGLRAPVWHEPDESGFFQPVLVARRPEAVAKVTGHDHI